MKKTICDKCGKELKEEEALELYIDGVGSAPEEYFDLCPECREKLIDWLAGSCPCKKHTEGAAKPEDKPADQPVKKTWTIKALAEKFGKSRSTIQTAIGKLVPRPTGERVCDPEKKDRWWYEYRLSGAQMKELAKRFKGGAK
jgi:hypothetical protein